MTDDEILQRLQEIGDALHEGWKAAPQPDDPRTTYVPDSIYEREGEVWGRVQDDLAEQFEDLIAKLNHGLPRAEVDAVSFDPESRCGRDVRALACDVSADLTRVFGDARLTVVAVEPRGFELRVHLPDREQFSNSQIREYLGALASSRRAAFPSVDFQLIENGQAWGAASNSTPDLDPFSLALRPARGLTR
jgi:hypothetical protein